MKRTTKVRHSRKIRRLRASAESGEESDVLWPNRSRMYKPRKKRVTLRLDADVLAWFKKPGHGYQTRINRALAAWIREKEKAFER